MNFGHVKWFVDSTVGSDLTTKSVSPLSTTEWLVVLFATTVGVYLLFLIDKWLRKSKLDRSIDKKTKNFQLILVPIVRITAGMILVVNYINNVIIAPNVAQNQVHKFWIVSSLIIGLFLLVGLFSKYSAVAMLGLFGSASLLVEPVELLDHLEYIGLSLFIIKTGGGNFSLDNKLIKSYKTPKQDIIVAQKYLLFWSGLAILILAFSEKLGNIHLASAFLLEHNWNLLSGVGISDRIFIIIAGVIEAVVGISLILRKAMRLTTLVTLGLMVTTAVLLGVQEVIGHIFAIAIVASAWLITPKDS